jgi:hypothetical protein
MVVGVPDHEAYGGSCGLSFKDAAEHMDRIGLLPGGRDIALSWTSPVQFRLNEFHIYGYTGWHAVDDTADGLTMAFAKCGQGEDISECVAH